MGAPEVALCLEVTAYIARRLLSRHAASLPMPSPIQMIPSPLHKFPTVSGVWLRGHCGTSCTHPATAAAAGNVCAGFWKSPCSRRVATHCCEEGVVVVDR